MTTKFDELFEGIMGESTNDPDFMESDEEKEEKDAEKKEKEEKEEKQID